jgi:hypothetical protein
MSDCDCRVRVHGLLMELSGSVGAVGRMLRMLHEDSLPWVESSATEPVLQSEWTELNNLLAEAERSLRVENSLQQLELAVRIQKRLNRHGDESNFGDT